MTEQKLFAPLAVAPDDFDFEEVDDEELDEIEICPGVFASRNILEGEQRRALNLLEDAETVKPLVLQAAKEVTRDNYQPREEVENASRIFMAVYDGTLKADDLAPHDSRIARFYKQLQRDEMKAFKQLFAMAIEYDYKLALEGAPGAAGADSPETAPAAPNASDLQEQPLQEQKHYLLNADEVAALLKIKKCMAYKIIRECNSELQAAGKLVIRGKVLKKYLLKKIEV